jgi:glycosyltransferase involved in cell wall biosynthesis
MRIAVVKADWRIRGGFEIVLDSVIAHLRAAGHRVELLEVAATSDSRYLYGRPVDDSTWHDAPEFFGYLSRYQSFQRLDLRRADLVISTQPPSFAVEHPRHMSIFYHHERQFYELADYYIRGGLADATMHAVAVDAVHRLDSAAMAGVGFVLAGSETIDRRLRSTGQVHAPIELFHAGASVVSAEPATGPNLSGPVLCVSRHDFPKRTELFVHASHLDSSEKWIAVGAGGRLGRLQKLSQQLAENCPSEIRDVDLWLCPFEYVPPVEGPVTFGSLTLAGAVTDNELKRLYQSAFCVVAPALLEDYGLTVIEAMQYGRPVIVCNDGGHLTDFIVDGVNGLVVEPTGAAIAEGVRRLRLDPELSAALGAAGRETFAQYSWSRAYGELDRAIEVFVA